MITKVLEKDIQRTILDYLKMMKVFHWRNNTGAVVRGKHFVRFGGCNNQTLMI